MDRAGQRETAAVDRLVRRLDIVAVAVDLDQRGGGDLVVEHAEPVDQEMLLPAGYARGDAGVDQVGPAEQIDQPIARREIDPGAPFGLAEPRSRHCRDCHLSPSRRDNTSSWRLFNSLCPGLARASTRR